MPEEPATPAVVTPPVEPVVPARDIAPSIVIEDLTPAQRRDVLAKSFEPAPKADEPKKEPETPPAEDPAKVEPAKPKEEPAPEPEPQEDPEEITKNFRLHTTDPKQSAFLKAYKSALSVNPEVNPADVARLVGYELPGQPAKVEEPALPQEAHDLVAARDRLAAIDAQIDAVENDTLITADFKGLLKQRGDALAAVSEAKLRSDFAVQREMDRRHSQTVTAREASKTETLKDYPTANDDSSELGTEIARLYEQVRDPKHPEHAAFMRNDGPRWITERAADAAVKRLVKNLGLTEAQALAVVKGDKTAAPGPVKAPLKQTPQTVPRTVLVTSPGGKTAPETTTMTNEQAIEAAHNNPKLRRELLFAGTNGVTIS